MRTRARQPADGRAGEQLAAKFGPVPDEIARRIESMQSVAVLDGFLERVLTANTPEEMKLD